MAHAAAAVANNFLEITGCRRTNITHMKLQKLVYYAHGWHLALAHAPLIDEGIEAWIYGPVVRSLYHEFKDLGHHPIQRKAVISVYENGRRDIEEPHVQNDEWGIAVIERIWEVYGEFTATQLSNMTHAPGTPWHTVTSDYPDGLPPYLRIPDDLIAGHFKQQLAS